MDNCHFITFIIHSYYNNITIKEKETNKMVKVRKVKRAINRVKIANIKDKTSTKILIYFTVGIMLSITGYAVKQIIDCGLSSCYIGGAGAGSIIVALIWLLFDSLKS